MVNLIGSKSGASFLDQSHNKVKTNQSRITSDTQLKLLCEKQIVSFLRTRQFLNVSLYIQTVYMHLKASFKLTARLANQPISDKEGRHTESFMSR